MFKSANRPNRLLRSTVGQAGTTNKRRETRVELQKAASIVVEATGQTLSCTLRDLHSRGARLSVANPAAVPDEFVLTSRQEGIETRARVAWRRSNEIGVRFIKY